MIRQLQKLYPSLLVFNGDLKDLNSDYKWFATGTNDIIGFPKDQLSSKEESLLAAFITPYNTDFPPLTPDEQKWNKIIHSDGLFDLDKPYRFIYFSINKNQITPVFFQNAIQELFAEQVPILWENENGGIIIERQTIVEDTTSYEQIIDVLTSDLYVKIKFFVGPFQHDLNIAATYYHSIIDSAKKAFSYSDKTVITYIDAIPYLLIDQIEPDLRRDISQIVLQEYLDDDETLKMIDMFVHCNLNISETAKRLHMHRNSLQYKLDRFEEKTGIDIRQFQQAMTVYLALLAKN